MKRGSNKYPKKAAKKGGVGEDQPSPKLEMMGGIQMVENECDNERSWGRGYEALGQGEGVQEWWLGVQGESDSPLYATTSKGIGNSWGVFWGVVGTRGACEYLGEGTNWVKNSK